MAFATAQRDDTEVQSSERSVRRGNTFSDALRSKGTPEELAALAWKAARDGEPWAIQMIYNRLEPQSAHVQLTHEEDNEDPIDYRRLTNEDIGKLESLLRRASTPVEEIEGGEGEATIP